MNSSKTYEYYQIYSLLSNHQDVNAILSNAIIERKFSAPYLGIALDENIKWETDINSISAILTRAPLVYLAERAPLGGGRILPPA